MHNVQLNSSIHLLLSKKISVLQVFIKSMILKLMGSLRVSLEPHRKNNETLAPWGHQTFCRVQNSFSLTQNNWEEVSYDLFQSTVPMTPTIFHQSMSLDSAVTPLTGFQYGNRNICCSKSISGFLNTNVCLCPITVRTDKFQPGGIPLVVKFKVKMIPSC